MDTQEAHDIAGVTFDLEGNLRRAVQETNIDLAPGGASMSISRSIEHDAEFILRCNASSSGGNPDRFACVALVAERLESRIHDLTLDDVIAEGIDLADATPERLYDRMALLAESLLQPDH